MRRTRFSVLGLAVLLAAMTALGGASVSAGQAAVQSGGAENSIAGTWVGVLGGQLHLVVTFTRANDGGLGGSLNSVDQHAVLALSEVTLKGNAVRLEVPRVGGVYEGKLSKDGARISGSWTQTGVPAQPLDFKRSGDANVASSTAAPPAAQTSPAQHTPKPFVVGIDTIVDTTPVAFESGGKWHIAYELHIANMDKWDYTFTEIDVVAAGAPETMLASYVGSGLAGIMTRPGLGAAGVEAPTVLAPGESGVAYLWVTADSLDAIPSAVRAKIKVKIGDYPEAMTAITPEVQVDKKPVVVIAPPLEGENLVAGNGPSNTSAHRRALIPVDGHAYISQRYAIDWVEAFPDGKTYQGDANENKNYKIYLAEIHSVADGVVTETKDGIPQNVPGANSRAVPITLETVGGNHMIVDIGGGRFAFYAHMQPGSLRVKVGEHVKTGEVLGLVGNTGNSTEPHLHFDICDASSMLACEGLPYALASFEVTGKAEDEGKIKLYATPVTRTLEIPAEDEIVRFGSGGK
ncbi:MAG: M23 family metallopeptidase [Candidatus Acidiferrales bacterium]